MTFTIDDGDDDYGDNEYDNDQMMTIIAVKSLRDDGDDDNDEGKLVGGSGK